MSHTQMRSMSGADARREGLFNPHLLRDARRLERDRFGVPRLANPGVLGIDNAVDAYLYDQVTVAANTAFPAVTNLFNQNVARNLAQSNVPGGIGRLPGGTRFNVSTLQLWISNNTVLTDLINIALNVSVQLVFSNKPFLQVPVYLLPAGCGMSYRAVAEVGTVAAGDVIAFSSTNGLEDPRAVHVFSPGLDVNDQEQFKVVLTAETAFNTANAGRPVATGVTITAVMAGKYYLVVN